MQNNATNGEQIAGIEDLLLLLLKAMFLARNTREMTLQKEDVLNAEKFDIMTSRGPDGRLLMKLVRGEDEKRSRIIMPSGESPLTIVSKL